MKVRQTMSSITRTSSLSMAILFLFLVAFPKAGFKVAEIPVTFGYLFLALAGIFSAIIGTARGTLFRFEKWQLYFLLALLPLQVLAALCVATLGSADRGFTIAFFVSFFILPTLFIFCLRGPFQQIDPRKFSVFLNRSVSFIVIYGIFLFAWRIRTGYFIEIPFLTVNANDVGELDTKNINRGGGIVKLISTYNNGNIFGVCVLMLLPLYDAASSSRIMKLLARLALLLTLSRTVWLGLIAYEILAALYVRNLNRTAIIVLFSSVSVISVGIFLALSYLGLSASFIFDSNLGGRADVLFSTKLAFLPQSAVIFPSEIIYINVVNAFGIAGLIAFCAAMFVPLVAAWKQSRKGEFDRSIALGMLMFLICGLSDGPMLLIPVMAIYWSLAMLGISRLSWPKHCSSRRSEAPLAPAASGEQSSLAL